LVREPPQVLALLVELVDDQNGAPHSECIVDRTRIIAHDDVVIENDLNRIDVRADQSYTRCSAELREIVLCMMELNRERNILTSQSLDDCSLVRQVPVSRHIE